MRRVRIESKTKIKIGAWIEVHVGLNALGKRLDEPRVLFQITIFSTIVTLLIFETNGATRAENNPF